MVPVPGAVRPFSCVFAMSNAKIISIMDAENKMQSMALAEDLELAVAFVDDEINRLRAELQNQINELKQRVRTLEEAGVTPEASA